MDHFGHQLAEAVLAAGNPCCVGIDPHEAQLPQEFQWQSDGVRRWGMQLVEVLAEVGIPVVKPQSAFFEAMGLESDLRDIIRRARDLGMHVILDAKRGDIGSTATAYAKAGIHPDGPTNADSMTVSPYLGPESLAPFLDVCRSHGKGIWVLVRTSNPGAAEWQCNERPSESRAPAYRIADWIEAQNREVSSEHRLGPVGAVVAATLSEHEVGELRKIMPSTWFLVPGYGAQGATAENLRGHFREDGLGAIVVSARGVLFGGKEPEGDEWKARVRERALAFITDMKTVMP